MELGQTQPLDEEEENKLWREFKKTKSSALRDKFIRQYMPLVKYVAGKVSVGLPASIEFDDLVGFGQFGLLDAITKFDPDKGVKFKTYAVTRIRGAIFDEMRQLDWVPRFGIPLGQTRYRCGSCQRDEYERGRIPAGCNESQRHKRSFAQRRMVFG